MITSFELENYGPIRRLQMKDCGHINLIIGHNRNGKTILLKALYAAQKTIELYKRGKNIETDKEILFKKQIKIIDFFCRMTFFFIFSTYNTTSGTRKFP